MDWQRINHFTADEFRCHCCGVEEMNQAFVETLDACRYKTGIPFHITSGFRCEKHDKEVGGKGNHPTGLAADIAAPDSAIRFLLLSEFLKKFGRIGIGKDFIHVDMNLKHQNFLCWLY